MLSLIIFALLVSIFIRVVYRPQDSLPSNPTELAAMREALARVEADRDDIKADRDNIKARYDNIEADRDNIADTLWKQNRHIALLVDRGVQTKTKELWGEVRDRDVALNQKDRQMRLFQQSRDDDVAQQVVVSMDRSIRAEKRVEELEAERCADKQRIVDLERENSALVLQHSYSLRRIDDWENGGIGTNSPAYLRAQAQSLEMKIVELHGDIQSLKDSHIHQLLQIVEFLSRNRQVPMLEVVQALQECVDKPLSPIVSKAINLLIADQEREAEMERLQALAATLTPPPPTPPPTRSSRRTGGNDSSDEEDNDSEGGSGSEDEGSGSEEDESSGSDEGGESGEDGGGESSEEEDL